MSFDDHTFASSLIADHFSNFLIAKTPCVARRIGNEALRGDPSQENGPLP